MKRLAATLLAVAVMTAPALAKQFIQDQAGMFSAQTVQQLNTRIGNFNAQTGKEIIVQTVPSVTGGDVQQAAENAFAQQQVNGVLIFIDKGDRKDYILPDRALVQSGWWSSQTSQSIANAMQAQFRAGDFDGGITTAVNGTLDVYRSHLGSLRASAGSAQAAQPYGATRSSYPQTQQGGMHIGVFWWIIIALFAFFIIRSIMRAATGPRYYGGGPGYGAGPGYGPGYGGYGYGGWGGGGGFWSGLLGGLGGAWLGNELFGHQNVGTGAWSNVDPTGGMQQSAGDAGGWQSDPGQSGIGGGGGGDWGGGGFGGGDFGGGGFGGGDGGAGGGW
jgi:uncharacterized membrane protein YgcG